MSKQTELDANESNRANAVSQMLAKITVDTKKNFFSVCDLLLEAYEGDYHKYFGCSKFGEWVEKSEWDIGSRNAYYYVTIAKKVRELSLDKDKLSEISISNLKEILSLDVATHEDTIRGLLGEADKLSTEEIKQKVRAVKSDNNEPVYCHLNFKFDETVKEMVEEALELARRNYGSVVDKDTGEVADISNGKCLELICASYLQDVNNYPEKAV